MIGFSYAPPIFKQIALAVSMIGHPTPDAACLTEMAYHEARGEPLQGQIAVAQVAVHRAEAESFPETLCGVVHQGKVHNGRPVLHRCAFSYWCDGKRERFTDTRAYREAKITTAFVLAGLYDDLTGGALYFHHAARLPHWSGGNGKLIGSQLFLASILE